MKRIFSVPAVVAAVLAAMIIGVGPASAAGSAVDCSSSDYTYSIYK